MRTLSEWVGVARANLPEEPLVCWASIFFTLFIPTLPISVAAAQAFLAAATALYGLHLVRTRVNPGFLPVKLPLFLFCVTTLVPIWWAENRAVGWVGARKLFLFVIWLLAVNVVVSLGHTVFLLQALALGATLAALVAAVQFVNQYRTVSAVYPHETYTRMTAVRIHGFMSHWMNFSGQEMLVFGALLAFLLLQGRGRQSSRASRVAGQEDSSVRAANAAGWVVWVIVATSIALSLTRGVWLGCFAAVIYIVARWRAKLLWFLPVLLTAGYAAAPNLVRERARSVMNPEADQTLALRFEMWGVGLRIIQEHPWVGVGPGNIVEVYPLYLPRGKVPLPLYHQHLHNDFLQLAAERGLPCLAVWIWLMAALLWHSVRIRRRFACQGGPTWIADAAIAGWIAFLLEGFFEYNFGTTPVLMVFLFLISVPFVAEKLLRLGEGRHSPAARPPC